MHACMYAYVELVGAGVSSSTGYEKSPASRDWPRTCVRIYMCIYMDLCVYIYACMYVCV